MLCSVCGAQEGGAGEVKISLLCEWNPSGREIVVSAGPTGTENLWPRLYPSRLLAPRVSTMAVELRNASAGDYSRQQQVDELMVSGQQRVGQMVGNATDNTSSLPPTPVLPDNDKWSRVTASGAVNGYTPGSKRTEPICPFISAG